MSDDSHDALPGLQLFLPQRPTQVRQYEQLMRQSTLTKRRSAHFPSSRSAGKHRVDKPLSGAFLEAVTQSDVFGFQADQSFRRGIQQSFAGAVYQAKPAFAVEGKHGDIDFFHYLPEKSRGLKRAQSLFAER